MIIDLHNYGRELEGWIGAFEPFVDKSSYNSLRRILDDLQMGREDTSSFPWKALRPIKSIVASAYDGSNKNAAPIYLTWQFHAHFTLSKSDGEKSKKRAKLWLVDEMVTHIKVFSEGNPATEAFHFHFDVKNPEQLGPHIHMQVSEDFVCKAGSLKLAVPRFPSAAVLPTDCFDIVLSEFFPHEWPKQQADSRMIRTLKQGQIDRALAIAKALYSRWTTSGLITPFSQVQNCHFPNLRLS